MRVTWRQRLAQSPRLREVSSWPLIPTDTLPARQRKAYLRNVRVVAEVLAGDTQATVAMRHNLSAGRVSQLLDRCLGGDDAQAPALNLSLVPNRVREPKRRRTPLSELGAPNGDNCAFQALLDAVPSLRDNLETLIKASLTRTKRAQPLSTMALHGEFKRTLAEAHWPKERYPYTGASCAYESVRRYLHQRVDELRRGNRQRKAGARAAVATPGVARHALRAVQIDEQTLDVHGSVTLSLNDELIPLRLARLTVLVAIDVDTRCVLGFHVAMTRAPNQQDLLALLEGCIVPHALWALSTPGLAYSPGAGFPATLPTPYPITFGTVHMDNAWIHSAHAVTHLLCEQMGATLALGRPAQPRTRALVESVFNYINLHCTHRLPSTTGSSPLDPKREPRRHAKSPPSITVTMIKEALSVILADYNTTPRAGLGNASPLSLFVHHCETEFVPFVPDVIRREWRPFVNSEERAVHRYVDEHRRPHVNFHYARYHGPGLDRVAGPKPRIRIEFDRRDIRTLHAYSLSGEDLGELKVSHSWRRFPHSLATREHLHRIAKRIGLSKQDPLGDYLRWLLTCRSQPSDALEYLRVHTEFIQNSRVSLCLDEQEFPTNARSAVTYRWSPAMANQGT